MFSLAQKLSLWESVNNHFDQIRDKKKGYYLYEYFVKIVRWLTYDYKKSFYIYIRD